jgi:hypothetical protein
MRRNSFSPPEAISYRLAIRRDIDQGDVRVANQELRAARLVYWTVEDREAGIEASVLATIRPAVTADASGR